MSLTVAIEVLIRDPEQRAGFVLDASRLSHPTSRLRPPLADEFILSAHQLAPVTVNPDSESEPSAGPGRLGPLPEPLTWFDLAPYTLDAVTHEGHRGDHPAWPVEPGSATINLSNAPDLQDLGLRRGTPIRIRTRFQIMNTLYDTLALVWAGWVTDWPTTYDKVTGETRTTLQAEDLAARLGNQIRYGVRHPGTQGLRARLNALATSSPVPVTVHTTTIADDAGLTPTVMETNLLAHMNMAATSSRHLLRIRTQDSSITWPDRKVSGSSIQLYDDRTNFDRGGIAGYSGLSVALDDPTTVLEVTTHEIGPDGNALDVTTTVENPTTTAIHGRQTATLDLTVPASRAAEIGAWVLPHYHNEQVVTAVEMPGPISYIPTRQRFLEPLDILRVYRAGKRYLVNILAVRHQWTLNAEHEVDHRLFMTTTQRRLTL